MISPAAIPGIFVVSPSNHTSPADRALGDLSGTSIFKTGFDVTPLLIPASVVTNDAADEDAFVRTDDETDVGFAESKLIRMAAFVEVVAREDFGCLCFQTNKARNDSYHQNLNDMDA